MDADWYVDPLGRFDGRFFDGEQWTERVSDAGALREDPDFPPAALTEERGLPFEPFVSESAAVAPLHVDRHLRASLMQESPGRVVAVLDDSVRNPAPYTTDAPAARKSRRGLIVWVLLALITALVVAGLVLLTNDDSPADPRAESVQLDRAQEARVQDLEASGVDDGTSAESIEELDVDVAPGAVVPGASFDPAETVQVGRLQVLNGQSMLADLQIWHREFAAERGVELRSSASCWFGQLGGAAVQQAFCGPVGGSLDTEFVFDSVPVLFEETSGGQVAQPVLDRATVDTVLANALTLVGRDGDPSPLLDE